MAGKSLVVATDDGLHSHYFPTYRRREQHRQADTEWRHQRDRAPIRPAALNWPRVMRSNVSRPITPLHRKRHAFAPPKISTGSDSAIARVSPQATITLARRTSATIERSGRSWVMQGMFPAAGSNK